jgi:hypothetical protein
MQLPEGLIPGTPELIALAVILAMVFCIDIYNVLKKLWKRKPR